ncbi:MAG: HlyD family efflux transporter periplasmic adaptor subunit [Acidobacteria bacterium]|nr:HlyD family efflux transporter periplasmic adaptor subunit [Acidobacteriota bacterium]
MRFGPTSLRLTSVLAKGLRRPKLREDLKVGEQILAEQISYVIKIPETESYARYGPLEYEILTLCDGTRTAADIAAAMNERHPDQLLSEEEVLEFLDGMDPGTWERSLGEKNLAILEKIRDERKKRVERSSLLYIYFSAWDPDKVLERIHPYLRWLFTREFVIFSLLLFAATTAIVIADFTRIRQDTIEFYSFTNKTAYDLWIFWVVTLVITAIHEFGHGLTCKHYGGEVHQMGFMLMYFMPSFYTDCTDMYLFDRSGKRVWTIMAGIWIELVACAIATFVWYLSPPGSFIGDLGYKTLLLTGVSGVFINLNPLMKLDGYFVLSQYLELDNLRDDSFEYLKAWLRRNLLRQDIDLPPASRQKRRIFLAFGTAAFLYSAMLLIVVTIFAKNIFTSRFGNWGYLMAGGLVYLFLRKRLQRWIPPARANLQEAKERFMAWRMTRLQQGVAAAILAFLVLIPTRSTVTTEFVLEPGARAEVRAGVPGLVSEVRVREGDTVEAGAVLAILHNAEVEARAAVVEQELKLAERALGAARARGYLGEIHKYSSERQRLETERAEASARRAALTLRAPIAGVVTTPQVEQQVGEYLDEGEEFAVLADRRTMRARVLVRDWELEEVLVGAQRQEGPQVKLNLRAYPFRSFSGRVGQIMPAAATDRPVAAPVKLERRGQELTNYFAVVMEFPNPQGVLWEGMTGTAKIYGRRYPPAWRAVRTTWRWLRSHLW